MAPMVTPVHQVEPDIDESVDTDRPWIAARFTGFVGFILFDESIQFGDRVGNKMIARFNKRELVQRHFRGTGFFGICQQLLPNDLRRIGREIGVIAQNLLAASKRLQIDAHVERLSLEVKDIRRVPRVGKVLEKMLALVVDCVALFCKLGTHFGFNVQFQRHAKL